MNSYDNQNYYYPSKKLVQYLENEFQSLQPRGTKDIAAEERGKPKFIRNKNNYQNLAKNKNDSMGRIFQSFADLLYFLEFIHSHPMVQDLYEKDLMDLFGISNDDNIGHKRNQGGAFERMIKAILLIEVNEKRELDFRVHLIKSLIWCCIEVMRSRITNKSETELMVSDTRPIHLWSDILSNRVKVDEASAHRRFGFCKLKYDWV